MKDARHDNKDVSVCTDSQENWSHVTGPTDRCAVPAFHLQVAALSLKTGASLTCHLSERAKLPGLLQV